MGKLAHIDIKHYILQYKLTRFFETGTGYGDGINYAKQLDFSRLASVEINESLFSFAKKRFENEPKIEIFHEESGTFVANYLAQEGLENERFFFFLDSHFPGADFLNQEYDQEKEKDVNIPLLKELKSISKVRKHLKDVIVIDDLRLFITDRRIQYWDVNAFWESRGSKARKENLVSFDLILSVKILFPNHDINYNFNDEGYLILTPK